MTVTPRQTAPLTRRALLAGLPLVALWLLGAGGGWTGLAVALGGVLAAVGLSLDRRTRGLSVVPLLLALAGLAATVPIGVVAELVAGSSALTALLWIARDGDDPVPIGRAAAGLALPSLAFGLALFTAVGIPAGEQFVGAAVVLLVVALGAVGWTLARPAQLPSAPSY